MTINDKNNPLEGLSSSQIILLFERGSRQKLNKSLRNIAINVVNQHQETVQNPTVESTMKTMLKRSELEEFAETAALRFLGENFDRDD